MQHLELLRQCVELGKVNATSLHPPSMRGQEGADELARRVLDEGASPEEVLSKALIAGMQHVGERFRNRQIFVPDVLMAAKAMSAAMEHLKPYFESNVLKRKGTFVIGTVTGDLHDIGKKLVGMIVRGAGWEVVDLGTDVSTESFRKAIDEHPGCIVGMSALLTTTMASMEASVRQIKTSSPSTIIIVGGAPVTQEFARRIGADAYSPDPQGAVEFMGAHALPTRNS